MMENLKERGQHLLESGEMSDCKFLVGKILCMEQIQAHKLYLAVSSPVFKKMFNEDMPELIEPIKVPDVDAETFKLMLKYVYTNELALKNIKEAEHLYYCADKYLMPVLAGKCVDYMRSVLSIEGVCQSYEFADCIMKPELLTACVDLMRTQTRKILNDSSWENAQKARVIFIFEQTHLNIHSELDLYHALVSWSRAFCP